MRQYTIGIGTTETSLVLIKKTKPEFQAGKFNFPGGKMEGTETGQECIAREWQEETGIKTTPESWTYAGKMFRENDFVVYIYTQENPEFLHCTSTTEEQIHIIPKLYIKINTKGIFIDDRTFVKYMPNLFWLYYYTQSDDFKKYRNTVDVTYEEMRSEYDNYGK